MRRDDALSNFLSLSSGTRKHAPLFFRHNRNPLLSRAVSPAMAATFRHGYENCSWLHPLSPSNHHPAPDSTLGHAQHWPTVPRDACPALRTVPRAFPFQLAGDVGLTRLSTSSGLVARQAISPTCPRSSQKLIALPRRAPITTRICPASLPRQRKFVATRR